MKEAAWPMVSHRVRRDPQGSCTLTPKGVRGSGGYVMWCEGRYKVGCGGGRVMTNLLNVYFITALWPMVNYNEKLLTSSKTK